MTKAEMQMFHDVNDKCQELIRENNALKKSLKEVTHANEACQSLSRHLIKIVRTRRDKDA
jgi:chaperonin cofactor prefoldin